MLLPEAAALVNVPVETLRYWVKKGRLRSYKPGRRVMVLRRDLVELVLRSQSGGETLARGGGADDGTARPAGANARQQDGDSPGKRGRRWRGKRGRT